MPDITGVDRDTLTALQEQQGALSPYWAKFGAPVPVTFPAANTRRDVVHGLQTKPDGYHVVWADGVVHAEPGVIWTTELAWLRATAANVHAILIFFTLRDAPLDQRGASL